MIESKQVMEWQAQALDRGLHQGRAEMLLEVLVGKFGSLPADLIDNLRHADVSTLRRIGSLAGRAESLEQLRRDGLVRPGGSFLDFATFDRAEM